MITHTNVFYPFLFFLCSSKDGAERDQPKDDIIYIVNKLQLHLHCHFKSISFFRGG